MRCNLHSQSSLASSPPLSTIPVSSSIFPKGELVQCDLRRLTAGKKQHSVSRKYCHIQLPVSSTHLEGRLKLPCCSSSSDFFPWSMNEPANDSQPPPSFNIEILFRAQGCNVMAVRRRGPVRKKGTFVCEKCNFSTPYHSFGRNCPFSSSVV